MIEDLVYDVVGYNTDEAYRDIVHTIFFILFPHQARLIEKQFGKFTKHIITDEDIKEFMETQNVTYRQAIEALGMKRAFEIKREELRI